MCLGKINTRRCKSHCVWLYAICLVGVLHFESVFAKDTTYDLSIPQGTLSQMLNNLAKQTDHSLIFPTDKFDQSVHDPLVGILTLRTALDELLCETGLSAVITDRQVIAISVEPNINDIKGVCNMKKSKKAPEQVALKNNKAKVSAACALAFFLCGNSNTALSAEPAAILEEIVVTARKREENLRDVPLSISAMTDSDMDAQGITTLQDIGDSTPGLDFAQAFGRQDFRPAIRGQANILGRANAGLFLDGIIIERGSASFPLAALERVEVVKGPQSALYGRSTLAGAINYVLKKPGDEFEGNVSIDGGQRGYAKVEGHFSGPVSDTLGLALTLSRYQRDGEYSNTLAANAFGTPAISNKVGGEETNSAALVFDFQPSERLSITGHAAYDDSDDDQFAIALQDAGLNNCFRVGVDTDSAGNVLTQPAPPAGTPEASAGSVNSAGYNGSGYFCGEVTTENALGADGTTNLETSFFDDSGSESESLRLGLRVNYELSDAYTLTGILGYNSTEESTRSDSTFGGGDISFPVVGVGSPFFVQGFGAPPTIQSRVGFIVGNDDEFDDNSQEIRLSYDNGGNLQYMIGVYRYSSESEGTQATSFDTQTSTFNGITAFSPFNPTFSPATLSTSAFYEGGPFGEQGANEVNSTSIFGSFDWALNETWSISAEARFNKDEFDFDPRDGTGAVTGDFDSFLPKVTISNKLSEDSLVYLNVAKGNKPGTLNTQNGVPTADVLVDEETAISTELGFKSTMMDGRLVANVALYNIDWTDLQLTTTRAATVNGQARTFSILQNVGEATINGLEVGLDFAATNSWTVKFGYAYTDSNIDEFIQSVDAGASAGSAFREAALIFGYQADGNVNITGTQLPQTSEHQLNFSNIFTGELSNDWSWTGRVDVNYNSERFAQVYNLASTGDRTIVNTRLGFQNDTMALELWADNLLDDDTPTALIRYVQGNDLTFNPFNRAIGVTLPEKRRVGVTARYNF